MVTVTVTAQRTVAESLIIFDGPFSGEGSLQAISFLRRKRRAHPGRFFLCGVWLLGNMYALVNIGYALEDTGFPPTFRFSRAFVISLGMGGISPISRGLASLWKTIENSLDLSDLTENYC